MPRFSWALSEGSSSSPLPRIQNKRILPPFVATRRVRPLPRPKKRLGSRETLNQPQIITPSHPRTHPRTFSQREILRTITQQFPRVNPPSITPSLAPPHFSFTAPIISPIPPCKYFSVPGHGTSADNRDDFFGEINFPPDTSIFLARDTHTDRQHTDTYLHSARFINILPIDNLLGEEIADVAPPFSGELNLFHAPAHIHSDDFPEYNGHLGAYNSTVVRTTSDAAAVVKSTGDDQRDAFNSTVVQTTSDATVVNTTCEGHIFNDPGTEPNIFEFDLQPVVNNVQPFQSDNNLPTRDCKEKDGILFAKLCARNKLKLLFQLSWQYQR